MNSYINIKIGEHIMDNTIIVNPGDIILIKIGKEKQLGSYVKIIDVVADKFKQNFWIVRFHPFVPTEDFKIITMAWKLDDDQIRGQEFTLNGVPHQLFKVKFPEDEITEPEKMFKDDPVPLPKLKNADKKKTFLKLVK